MFDRGHAAVVSVDSNGVITQCAYLLIDTDAPANPRVVKTIASWPREKAPVAHE